MWRSTARIIVTLVLGIITVPLAVNARQRDHIPRIGVIGYGNPPSEADLQRSPFRQELRTLGWVEGQNMVLTSPWREFS